MTEEKLVYVIFNCTYRNGENEYKENWTERMPAEQLDSFLRDDNVLADYIGFPDYNVYGNGWWASQYREDVVKHFDVQEISETVYDVLNKFDI
jgi:hypothetical protein|tara:strand:+ start:2181 stop:2459 length:279 start_codon:yes stop_codon:yes gene_type:complete